MAGGSAWQCPRRDEHCVAADLYLGCPELSGQGSIRIFTGRPGAAVGHPDFVLAAAARLGIVTAAEAELIGRNRLEGIPLARIAAPTAAGSAPWMRPRARARRGHPPDLPGGPGRACASARSTAG